MPKVSVIVPVYNCKQEIRDCLDSLIEQTEKDLEIIIIDDKSTDGSLEIIKEYQQKHPNIQLYQNEQNLGQGPTRNKGIQLATGDYITFLDSDDYINPGMYEELYQTALTSNMPELITTGLIFVVGDEYRKKDLNFIEKVSKKVISPLKNPNAVFFESPSLCNKLFRKDTIKDYHFLNVSAWEDIAFSLTKFLEAENIVEKPTVNYFYRRNINKGVSSKNFTENDKIMDIFTVADELEEELKRNGKYPFFVEQIKGLQIAICLQRVDEVNYWPNEDKKETVKKQLFSTIYEKYGTLEEVDKDLISSKTGFKVLDEYSDYLEKRKTKEKAYINSQKNLYTKGR